MKFTSLLVGLLLSCITAYATLAEMPRPRDGVRPSPCQRDFDLGCTHGYEEHAMAKKTVRFIIRRQPTPESQSHWEEFDLRWRAGMNVITGLMDIAENPVDRLGKATTPIVYDANCLEEVCGSCAMLINGKASMACSALVHKLEHPVRLEPLSKFQVVRDLAVDRGVLFENLKRVKAWVPVDGTYDLGPGPRIQPSTQEEMYPLSRCISCCLCLEACPEVNERTGFVGAAIINQVRLFNEHPTGKALKAERIKSMMGDGGIHGCSFAQNCVRICPNPHTFSSNHSCSDGREF